MATLHEVTHCQNAPQIDREAGVIRNVKVLGAESKNGRRYSEKAMREAAELYKGRDVNLDHPGRGDTGERKLGDAFGWLESVTVKPDGVYADLHYLKEHPSAPMIVEAAERNPRRIGLSHNAEGTVVRKDGKNVVESIATVKSVDIVQTPATVNGLFESAGVTPRELLEEWQPGMGSGLPPVEGADEPMEAPETDDSQERAKAAVVQLLTVALDTPGDIKSLVMAVMDVAQKIMGGLPAEEESPEEMPDSEEETEDDETPAPGDEAAAQGPMMPDEGDPMKKRKPAMAEATNQKPDPAMAKLLESIQSELRELKAAQAAAKARQDAVSLLESANRDVTEVRVTALLSAASDEIRKSLVESWPAKSRFEQRIKPAAGAASLREASAVKYPEDVRSFVSALR